LQVHSQGQAATVVIENFKVQDSVQASCFMNNKHACQWFYYKLRTYEFCFQL